MLIRDPKTAEIGREILPFEMGYVPEYFQEKAEIELQDTPEMKKKCLHQIKELIKKDGSLANIALDDDFLLLFLLSRKYNVMRALKNVKAYINFKERYAEIFTNPTFETLSGATLSKVVTFLPWRCQDGCVIILVQVGNWDPDLFSVEYLKKFYVVALTQLLRDPMTQVNGFKVLLDLDINLKHIRACTPRNLYMWYYGTQEVLPGRFREIHCIKTTAIARGMWYLMKTFMTEKIKNRVHFHAINDTLLNFFPRAVLPRELGGDLEHYDSTEWLRRTMMPENLQNWDIVKLTGEK